MSFVLRLPSGNTRKQNTAGNFPTKKAAGKAAFFVASYTKADSQKGMTTTLLVIAALVIAHGAYGKIPGNGVIEQQGTYR